MDVDADTGPLDLVTSKLAGVLPELRGEWISLSRHYEAACASALGAKPSQSPHHDCELGTIRIELKKTKSGGMWFDLVRYSTALLDGSVSDVVTAVLRYTLVPQPHARARH
ncbi:MAG: hypothetical protein H0V68_10000 [Actinobacteria bacterium]|nr:hypothetical protein [Actinomycetota bacterium]